MTIRVIFLASLRWNESCNVECHLDENGSEMQAGPFRTIIVDVSRKRLWNAGPARWRSYWDTGVPFVDGCANTEAHFAYLIEHGNEVDHSYACERCLRMTMRDWMRKVSVMTRDRSKVLYILRRGLKRETHPFGVDHIHIPGNETNQGTTGWMVRLGLYFGVALLVRCVFGG